MRPQPRVQMKKAHERSHHRYTGVNPAFPAQWLYGLLRALPGDQACLTPSPALLIADLTPASGRQNHTTSPSAAAHFVKRTARVHRIPPRVDDVAQRPSVGTGRPTYITDLGQAASKISEIPKSARPALEQFAVAKADRHGMVTPDAREDQRTTRSVYR